LIYYLNEGIVLVRGRKDMEENDRILTEAGEGLNLLVDSSAYHEMNKIADAVGQHPLILLEAYPKIHNFFSQAMIK